MQDGDRVWGGRAYTCSRVLGEFPGTREQLSWVGQGGCDRGAKAQPGGLSSEPPSERDPWAGGGPEPLPPAPHLPASSGSGLSSAAPPHTLSASFPGLRAQGCPETWGWGLEGDKTLKFSWLARTDAQSALDPCLALNVENHPLDRRPRAPPIVSRAPTSRITSSLWPTLRQGAWSHLGLVPEALQGWKCDLRYLPGPQQLPNWFSSLHHPPTAGRTSLEVYLWSTSSELILRRT